MSNLEVPHLLKPNMKYLSFLLLSFSLAAQAQVNPKLQGKLEQQARDIEQKVIEWRRHFHQYPELSNPSPFMYSAMYAPVLVSRLESSGYW